MLQYCSFITKVLSIQLIHFFVVVTVAVAVCVSSNSIDFYNTTIMYSMIYGAKYVTLNNNNKKGKRSLNRNEAQCIKGCELYLLNK